MAFPDVALGRRLDGPAALNADGPAARPPAEA
jgi:hypothetical protein